MIIVVGASSSIGKQLLPDLLKIDKVLGTTTSIEKLAEFESSPNFSSLELDLADKDSIEAACSIFSKLKGKVTFLNLSAVSIDKLFMSYTQDEWDLAMNLNLNSGIRLIQSLIPVMMRAKWGRIISTSSIVAHNCPAGTAAYAASKAGLIAMTKTLAHEYGRFGITANTLTLGYFDSGLTRSINEKMQQEIMKRIPRGAFGSCTDISHAINFIIKTDFLSGSEITIDGGYN
ncbi:SDR family oxidoreductase [Maridesulfovibrio sp.]|uniref:SDR family oxidoreductase n=1 Tax=Maridesulfovibrio sp. TaxID=2795000 RepID=UPI0029CA93B4|nr:SDR family oxidoreductase [Maridesulfovibrio sp.]